MAPNLIFFPTPTVSGATLIQRSTPAPVLSIEQLRRCIERQFAHRSKSRPWELLSAPAETPRFHRAG